MFTDVCLSTGGLVPGVSGWGSLVPGGCLVWEGLVPGGACSRGVLVEPPPTATAVVGMHPTGMHPCITLFD